jgi:hypothetical protein
MQDTMMKSNQLIFKALAASVMLAGCSGTEQTIREAKSKLTITGPRDGVERFAKLQGALRPAIAMSTIKLFGRNQAEAEVILPAGVNGPDIVHTTREALAAGLSYKFEQHESVRTVRT